jgi:hypothetical protein
MVASPCLWLMRVALPLIVIILFAAACGGGGSGPAITDLAHQRPALTIVGAQSKDGLGPVASGDVNGDGETDLIVGAPYADGPDDSRPDAGEAYVILGPSRGGTLDLSRDEPDVTIFGADSGDFLGFAVQSGDVNGDGFADILLGAPLADGPDEQRPDAGEMYLILGGPALAPTLDLAQGEQDLIIFGADSEDSLGAAMVAGDSSGDGNDDILVGAFLADGPDNTRYQAGEAYLLLGSPSLSGKRDMAQGEFDLAILAPSGDEQLGHYLAMGDLDGDQRDDLIVSAFRTDGPHHEREDAGAVYVFFAAAGLKGVVDLATASPGLVIYGADAFDDLGVGLAAADLNGDDIADLVVGAPRADPIGAAGPRDGAGEAYVFFGGPSLTGSRDIAQGQQDVILLAADPDDHFGAALATADLDDDGKPEVIVGAERGDGPDNQRQEAGEVYVVRGSGALPASLDMAADAYDAIVFGERSGDKLGAFLTTADWDGDGRPDLLVGAPFADGPDDRTDCGAAYVLSGPSLLK